MSPSLEKEMMMKFTGGLSSRIHKGKGGAADAAGASAKKRKGKREKEENEHRTSNVQRPTSNGRGRRIGKDHKLHIYNMEIKSACIFIPWRLPA